MQGPLAVFHCNFTETNLDPPDTESESNNGAGRISEFDDIDNSLDRQITLPTNPTPVDGIANSLTGLEVEFSFDDLDADDAISESLRRQCHTDGGEAQIAIAQLHLAQAFPHGSEIKIRAGIVGQHAEIGRGQNRIAFDMIGFDV